MVVGVGAALGKLSKLVHALDGDTVCVAVGAALCKLVDVLDCDTVCVVVGVALGKLVHVLDGDTVCMASWSPYSTETRSAW